MAKTDFKNTEEYIATFPKETQVVLQEIRRTIQKAVPEATERISYQMPSFALNGKSFFYFGGYKNHTSIYPVPRGNAEFKNELKNYAGGKGTAQFPLDKSLPLDLITKVANFRANELKNKM